MFLAAGWSDVPSWLQGAGSIFALGFAAVAVVVTRRTYQIESERDRVNEEARDAQRSFTRRAQAALVSAWWGASADGRSGAFIRNASETPIYQTCLTILAADDRSDQTKISLPLVPPSDEALFCPIDQIQPASDATAHRVKLTFTDATGIRWLRNQYGRLTELQSKLRIKADPVTSAVLTEFQEDFLATYGVTASFETDAAGHPQETFVAALQTEAMADALICPHDWLGDLIARDVIEPTVLSADHHVQFPSWALSALTVDGRLYGLPTTVDTVALLRNTDLAPQSPQTFDELLATGQALRDAGRTSHVLALRVGGNGDPFQIWPLFTSAGGWLFHRTADGDWDPSSIGLATAESIAAWERLQALGEAGSGVLRRSIDRSTAIELFATGQSPYLISTSDALRRARKSGIPVAVSAVPPFRDGRPASAFALVHGLVMTKNGLNKVIAHDLFADYLTHHHVMAALSDGIVAPTAASTMASDDKALQQFMTLCEAAMPMPSFPQMDATWRILERLEVAVIAGGDVKKVARQGAAEVAALFAKR
jgi:arabinogalactan oligomer/maltooligosaccharide transport system substrate-binding protein